MSCHIDYLSDVKMACNLLAQHLFAWTEPEMSIAELLKDVVSRLALLEGYRTEFDKEDIGKITFIKVVNIHKDMPDTVRIGIV